MNTMSKMIPLIAQGIRSFGFDYGTDYSPGSAPRVSESAKDVSIRKSDLVQPILSKKKLKKIKNKRKNK